ncbi:MAG: DUF4912 domain-containing protein [Cyanothece sp. SIO2G6]|nr:DUF4912 domain-containing protein [Cyanothece sp. SIO2G6]
MKSLFSLVRSLPVMLLFAVTLSPIVNRSPWTTALTQNLVQDTTLVSDITLLMPEPGSNDGMTTNWMRVQTNNGSADLEGGNATTGNTATGESTTDPATRPESSERHSLLGWLWLLGLPLLALLIWWVLVKESGHAEEDEEEAVEVLALAALASDLASDEDEAQLTPDDATAGSAQPTLPSSNPAAADTITAAHLLPSLLPSQLSLIPEGGQTVRICWDVTAEAKTTLRQQGGERLVLQIYDVTNIDPRQEKPHSVQQFDCDETLTELQVTVPRVNRRYLADLGYITRDGQWLRLAHSAPTDVVGNPESASFVAESSPPESSPSESSPSESSPPESSSPETSSSESNAAENNAAETSSSETSSAENNAPESNGNPADRSEVVDVADRGGVVDTPNGQSTPLPAPTINAADASSSIAIISDAIASDQESDQDTLTTDSFPTDPPTHLWIAASGTTAVQVGWELPAAIATYLERQNIQTLSLLIHDVTWIDLDSCPAHHTEQVDCSVAERDRTVPIWATNRDYLAELGYTDARNTWVRMARSTHIGIASA